MKHVNPVKMIIEDLNIICPILEEECKQPSLISFFSNGKAQFHCGKCPYSEGKILMIFQHEEDKTNET